MSPINFKRTFSEISFMKNNSFMKEVERRKQKNA